MISTEVYDVIPTVGTQIELPKTGNKQVFLTEAELSDVLTQADMKVENMTQYKQTSQSSTLDTETVPVKVLADALKAAINFGQINKDKIVDYTYEVSIDQTKYVLYLGLNFEYGTQDQEDAITHYEEYVA